MTLRRAYLTATLSAIVCSAIGMSLGGCIGRFAFSPVQFGVVMGRIQGLFTGLGLAIIFCGIVAWHDVRTRQISSDNFSSTSETT